MKTPRDPYQMAFDQESADNQALWARIAEAAMHGDESALRQMLGEAKAPEPAPRDFGSSRTPSALMMAALSGLTGCAQALLPLADIGRLTSMDETALMLAAQRGHIGVVRLLIPVSDASQVSAHQKLDALMLAAANGHAECVSALIPVSDPRRRGSGLGWTALMMAAAVPSNAECALALAQVSELEAKDEEGRTALLLAAKNKSSVAVKMLLAAGADPLARDAQHFSPLTHAVKQGDQGSIDALWGISDPGRKILMRKPGSAGYEDRELVDLAQVALWGRAPELAPEIRARLEAEELRGSLALPSKESLPAPRI